MEEQENMFGTDHIYGVDLFNEVEAPSWDPQTLADIARGAYESMAAVDPEAVWLQMGWMFYYDRKHWTKENIEQYSDLIAAEGGADVRFRELEFRGEMRVSLLARHDGLMLYEADVEGLVGQMGRAFHGNEFRCCHFVFSFLWFWVWF